MSIIMIQFQWPFLIIFSVVFLSLSGCAKKEATTPSKSIDQIQIQATTTDKIYTIYVNDDPVGTTAIKIQTGNLQTFNDVQYSHVIEVKETTIIYNKSGEIQTYSKLKSDGYIMLSEDTNHLKKYIPFPLSIGTPLFGPFSAITSHNIEVSVVNIHENYINKNGHVFNDVIEARNSDETIRVFLNNDDFIIQKEDYRYVPTVQSLKR
jgi:hypothetical protein